MNVPVFVVSIIVFLRFFLPLILVGMFYIYNDAGKRLVSNIIVVLMFSVTMLNFLAMLGINLGQLSVLFGYFSIVWIMLFWVLYAVFKSKNYEESVSNLLAFIITVMCIPTWELTINVLTVYGNLNVEQMLLTVMLASPYLLLHIPVIHEVRVNRVMPVSQYLAIYLAFPVLLGCLFIFFNLAFPDNVVQMVMRVFWALAVILLASEFPSKVVAP